MKMNFLSQQVSFSDNTASKFEVYNLILFKMFHI